ncbi:MAG: hypothetical protein HRT88_19850 [Lentisphaeraceae bacterium]|nr:hypothetical protein [Lentisphaeraceae bacterium]
MNKKVKKIMALLTVLSSMGLVGLTVYAGCNSVNGTRAEIQAKVTIEIKKQDGSWVELSPGEGLTDIIPASHDIKWLCDIYGEENNERVELPDETKEYDWSGADIASGTTENEYIVEGGYETSGDQTATCAVKALPWESETCELQGSESPTATFSVCDLSCSKSHSRRTAGGPTETLFEINEGEHYEVGGTFEFKLEEENYNTPSHLETIGDYITYELWDLDGIDEKITSGTGSSFSHTFTSDDEGDAVIWWYFDGNGDDEWNYIADEAGTQSKDFVVKEVVPYKLVTTYSDLLGNLPSSSDISELYADATEILIKKDAQDDYRACVKITLKSLTSFVANKVVDGVLGTSLSRQDPANSYFKRLEHYNGSEDVTFLASIGYDSDGRDVRGLTSYYSWHKILLRWDRRSHYIVAHELGHGVGNWHDFDDPRYIMSYGFTTGANSNVLTKGHANAYD